jgi:co-chaperonin GroES (HSP10)
MIKPVNGHLIIEPVSHEEFIASQNTTYQEIGVVVSIDEVDYIKAKVGDKVYFDSWLAAKYPKTNGEFYWLVKWEDVRAIEHVE